MLVMIKKLIFLELTTYTFSGAKLENKSFQIDANIINKKRSNKPINKNSNLKKEKKSSKNNFFIITFCFIVFLSIGLVFWINKNSELIKKEFFDGKIIVCKDRLVSKELSYIFNKKEDAFINAKEGLFFSIYYCSRYNN